MTNLILTIVFVLSFSLVSFAQCKDTSAERAAFAQLPVSEKVALWRDHLLAELKTRRLNDDQRHLIAQGLSMLDEAFYARAQDSKAYAKFRSDLRANFSLKEGSEIFEQLPGFKIKTPNDDEPPSLAPYECNCSTTWTFCEGAAQCSTSCQACVRCTNVVNCGPFWGFSCNGMCSDIQP